MVFGWWFVSGICLLNGTSVLLEVEMRLLCWSVLLLIQWILRKVWSSFLWVICRWDRCDANLILCESWMCCFCAFPFKKKTHTQCIKMHFSWNAVRSIKKNLIITLIFWGCSSLKLLKIKFLHLHRWLHDNLSIAQKEKIITQPAKLESLFLNIHILYCTEFLYCKVHV